MKKSVLALAVLGAVSTGAFAQTSNVTIYGLIDEGFVSEHGGAAGAVNKLTSGVGLGSRLGFKGTEDLGGGLSAIFLLENGFQADTGALGQSATTPTLFGRQAFVGLSSKDLGTVTLGRQYTPEYLVQAAVDPFGTGYAGDSKNLMTASGSTVGNSRMDNTVKYATPTWAGFSGEAVYGFGEVAGNNARSRQYGFAAGYANGPLWVRVGYHNRNNDTATLSNTDNAKNTIIAGTYDFGVVKAHLAYRIDKGDGSSAPRTANIYGFTPAPANSKDARDILVGVTVPFGGNQKILASYIDKNDRDAANNDARQYAIGYVYSLSKRTDLYAAYAKIKNKNQASYSVGSAIEGGSGDSAYNLGLRHTF